MITSVLDTTSTFFSYTVDPVLSTLSTIAQSTIAQVAVGFTAIAGLGYLAGNFRPNLKEASNDDFPIFAKYLNFSEEEDIEAVADILKRLPSKERKEFIQTARDFFDSSDIIWDEILKNPKDWDEDHALELLENIADIPRDQRKILSSNMAQFIYEYEIEPNEIDHISNILKTLKEKSTEEIHEIFHCTINILAVTDLKDEEHILFLSFMANLSTEKRDQFLYHIAHWIEKKYGESIPQEYLTTMIDVFKKEQDIELFLDCEKVFLHHYHHSIKEGNTSFLQVLMHVDVKDLQTVFDATLVFLGAHNAFFAKIEDQDLQTSILIFISENKDLIPLLSILSEGLWSTEDKLKLLEQLFIAPEEERLELLQFTWRLMGENPKGGIPGNLIEKLLTLPRNQRAKLVELTEKIFPLFKEKPLLLDRFIDLGDELEPLIKQVIENPMRQEEIFWLFFPQPGQMTLAAQNGESSLDVHKDKRDEKTRDAFFLLKKATQTMYKNEIRKNAEDFLLYLQARNACNALFLLTNKDPSSSFPSPFLDPFCLIGNTSTSGEEIIGRMVYFINSLDDKEKGNTLESMIAILSKECTIGGQRICPPGITERLFISVLQGRLKGVQIDEPGDIGLILIRNPSQKEDPVKSLNDFFSSPKHQQITDYRALLKAAEIFYQAKENVVDKENFFKQLEEYAIHQDIKK